MTEKPEDINLPNRNGESVVHSKGDVTEISTPGPQADQTVKTATVDYAVSVDAYNQSDLGSVRRIDASLLNFKHILTAGLIIFISAAVYMLYPENLAT